MIQSDNFQLKSLDPRNRGLFASKQIKPWQTIMECTPICTSIRTELRNKFCHHCLKQTQVLRCSRCKIYYYCSVQCQQVDWSLHRSQCRVLGKLTSQKNVKRENVSMDFLINLRLWVCRGKDQGVDAWIREMCSFVEFQLPDKLKHFQQMAVVLAQNLGLQKSQQTLQLLIKQQSIVSLNSFTLQDYLCNHNSIGIGLYWPANFVNHHCHPNSTQIFDGRNLKILANRPIQPGEQITISYMPRLEGLDERKRLCREEYLFQCFCEECQVGKLFDEGVMYVKCGGCGECSIKKGKKEKAESQQKHASDSDSQDQNKKKQKQTQEYQCQKCKKKISVDQLNKIIDRSNQLLTIISSKSTQSDQYQRKKKTLLQLRKLLSQNSPKFQTPIHQTYLCSLQQAQTNPQIYSQSYLLLKQMITLMPTWYRLHPQQQIPYIYIWRYAELGKLAYNLHKYKKACECTEKAYEIVSKIGFKNEFEEVKELKSRYEEMKVGLSFNKAEIFRGGR